MPANHLKHHSEGTKIKISEGMFRSGKRLGCPIGFKRSEETKNKLSKALTLSWSTKKKSDKNDYQSMRVKFHPNAGKSGLIKKHRIIMERHIGRLLSRDEVVHHIDGNKRNNSIDNLMLFKDRNEHKKFHIQMEKIGMFVYSFLRKKLCANS